MDYILFGIQGAGKGTQGKILTERLKAQGTAKAVSYSGVEGKTAHYFEMGGELRRLSSENSPLGQKVKSIIDQGNLVPNEVVMEIVENFARHTAVGAPHETSIVFDGIPRNSEQDASLQTLLQKLGRTYEGIYFELPRASAEDRLIKRRICVNCKTVHPAFYKADSCQNCSGQLVTRADDNAEAIKRRIDIFFSETLPLIEQWKKAGKMITVDGSGTIEQVTQELFSKLKI